MIRRPPRSTQSRSSAASDVYKRQVLTTHEEPMASKLFGEFMGTMVLILMGNGAVANMLLKRSKAEGAGWMAITTGWAFAVMTGVFTAIACGSPDAHLNPAVTLGFAVKTGDFSLLAPFAVAQLLGAMAVSYTHLRAHETRHDIVCR